MQAQHPIRYAPSVLRLEPPHDVHPAEALLRLHRRARPALLDSAGGEPRRFSLLAFDPVEVERDAGLEALAGLSAFAARLAPPPEPLPGPFQGGFVGALAYDLGVEGEGLALPDEPWGFPLVVGGLYTDFLVRDEATGATWLVLGEADRRDEVLAELEREPELEPARAAGPLVRHVSSAAHRARIERVRAWIAEGEMYQANVAHRFTRPMAGDPRALYARLRAENPAPYAGYLGWEEGALLSSSPELLLEFEPGGADTERAARTRPIKGTLPRGADAAEDEANARALLASEKDRAELAMIVDLERNDLGRIAAPGTVRVDGFPRLESYASVHHLVADVACRPRAGVGAVDALAALFPGGSITGAPKLRSMEGIAEVEEEGRGFFTGSLGFLDTRGHAVFNILIRSLLWRPGEVSFRVGGGITWASDAAAEDAETLAKGAALARALEGVPSACP